MHIIVTLELHERDIVDVMNGNFGYDIDGRPMIRAEVVRIDTRLRESSQKTPTIFHTPES